MKQNSKTIAIVAVSFLLLFVIVGVLLTYMSSLGTSADAGVQEPQSAFSRLFGGGLRDTRLSSDPASDGDAADQPEDAVLAEDTVSVEVITPERGEGVDEAASAEDVTGTDASADIAEVAEATVDSGEGTAEDATTANVEVTGLAEEEVPVSNQPRQINAPYTVYKNTLTKGWENRSWDTNINFAGFPAYDGLTAIVVHFAAPDGAMYLYTPEPINARDYNVLRFWVNGGTGGGQLIEVALIDGDENVLAAVPLTPPYPNNWRQVDILLEDLGDPDTIQGLVFRDTLGEAQSVFYVDEMSFIDDPLAGKFEETQINGPALTVFTQDERHEISPYIYGMNFAPEALARELRLPINRWGGNAVTRYNYLEDATNTANNWYFENIPPSDPPPTLPRGSSGDDFVNQNIRSETETLMTMPMLGWVARADYSCSYNSEDVGEMVETDEEWRPECGAGVLMNGDRLEAVDPNITSDPADEKWVQGWFKHLIGEFGTAAEGGVQFWNYDNEPFLWTHTHSDIRDEPLSTDEIIERTKAYGMALKAVDPSAQALGPVTWGWSSFFWSDVDVRDDGDPKVSAPDREAHGNLPFTAYYLQEMKRHEDETGVRILDYLDLHFYPQAGGIAFSEVGGESLQALRMRTTRSLWDASYVDESWIAEPVNLIPMMHEWVDTFYPGTQLAISEYNWGGLEHINGAIAQADVLGIFGREDLDLATLWGPPTAKMPGAFAFRMFLNYDGRGSRFGDISIHAESENSDQMAIFAAKRASDGAMTVMILNKSTIPMTSEVIMRGMGDAGAEVFRYGQANLGSIERVPNLKVEEGKFIETFDPYSITLYVFPGSGTVAAAAASAAAAADQVEVENDD